MAVRVLDAGGGKVMLTGDARSEVEAALQKYLDSGSKVIAVVALVGRSWVAACTPPATVESLDDSQTLKLSEISERIGMGQDDTELCRVETVGFKKFITGPTRVVVAAKVDELKQFGAIQIGEVEAVDGQWTAMVDTADAKSTGYRW
ncbi:MAG: hypothetical protein ACT4P9_00110 [Betaproteobacteria bacterium]